MFKVRTEQMAAYPAAALRDFEDRVVQHVERCFPDRLATRELPPRPRAKD
jgi:hypothetical protein